MDRGNSLVPTTRLDTLIARNSREVNIKDKEGFLEYLFYYACSYIEFMGKNIQEEEKNLEGLVYKRASEMIEVAQSQSVYQNRSIGLIFRDSEDAYLDVLEKYDSQAYAKIMSEKKKSEVKYQDGQSEFQDFSEEDDYETGYREGLEDGYDEGYEDGKKKRKKRRFDEDDWEEGDDPNKN